MVKHANNAASKNQISCIVVLRVKRIRCDAQHTKPSTSSASPTVGHIDVECTLQSHEPETQSEVQQVQVQVQVQPHPYIRGPNTAPSPSRASHHGARVFVFGRFWCFLPGREYKHEREHELGQQRGYKRKSNSEANCEAEYDSDSDSESTFVGEDFTKGDGGVEWGGDVEMDDGDGVSDSKGEGSDGFNSSLGSSQW
ncbi:hypothetical protein IAQ61_001892 [Plenodomus lingam]|uniref:uncharacterized protein n=1 Tax=Leptosphaeria maculans TaxID=5022 RepID=UPI00332949E1|nr:hypothetical protein IAQ61_001892 [Plenodomus lingam]